MQIMKSTAASCRNPFRSLFCDGTEKVVRKFDSLGVIEKIRHFNSDSRFHF